MKAGCYVGNKKFSAMDTTGLYSPAKRLTPNIYRYHLLWYLMHRSYSSNEQNDIRTFPKQP